MARKGSISNSLHALRGMTPTQGQPLALLRGPALFLKGPPGVELHRTAQPVPVPAGTCGAAQPTSNPGTGGGGVKSRGWGSANYLELRGQEEAANQSWRVRARPGGRKVAPPAGAEYQWRRGGGGAGPGAALYRPRAAGPARAAGPTHAAAAPGRACTCSSRRSRPRRGRRIWGSPSASPSSSSRTRARSAPRTAPACR